MHDFLKTLRSPRMIGLGILAIVCVVVFINLAQWQADRSTEENAKSDAFRENVSAAPVDMSVLVAPGEPLDPDEEFRAVTATGVYDADAQVLVRNRSQNRASGLVVAAPLRTSDGVWLWVARGWIPAGGTAAAALDAPAPPTGTVTVSGIARPSETAPGAVIRPADIPSGQVTALNVVALTAELGGVAYDAILQADLETPPPAEAIEPLAPPQGVGGGLQQLSYAVQWVIFAVIAVVGFFMVVRLESRERREKTGSVEEPVGSATSVGSEQPASSESAVRSE